MSVLAWLFGLGAAAVAFPFLFHLIRRTPKGKTEFSSLMFLSPSPPRLTRRSRLDDFLLLALRCAALLLLALAFMRPFYRSASQDHLVQQPGRRVAILVDTSASMRRGDLLQQAIDTSQELLDQLPAEDSVALFSFADQIETLVEFAEEEPDANRDEIASQIKSLSPTWESTDLGTSIAAVVDQMAVMDEQGKTGSQIFVISDFQKSASINALQSMEWPENVQLKMLPVQTDQHNASVQILHGRNGVEEATEEGGPKKNESLRVRIRNHSDSPQQQFRLAWSDSSGLPGAEANSLPHYVAPGQSQIVQVSLEDAGDSSVITLLGDQSEFDNQYHFVPVIKENYRVLYLGNESNADPESLRYYFSRALFDSPSRRIEIVERDDIGVEMPSLVLVTSKLAEEDKELLDRLYKDGVLVFFVAADAEAGQSFAPWIGGEFDNEADELKSNYSLLADLDFQHPIFAPFNSPRFNDFTKIKIWRHALFQPDEKCTVIARFDDEHPALWTREQDESRMIGMSFGWRPDDSQLARSTKFVPMLKQILDQGINRSDPILTAKVGQPIPIDPDWSSVTVTRPDQTTEAVASQAYLNTDIPGVYSISADSEVVQQFAVNIAASESETLQLSQEPLAALGVSFGEQSTAEEQAALQRLMKDRQLEGQQKIWKWAILLTLLLLLAETVCSARRTHRIATPEVATS